MKATRICIVDDDHIYRYMSSIMLQQCNFPQKLLFFTNGEEAINFLIDNVANATELPDVIFLDLNMPRMNGWEFLENYARLKPRLEKSITIYVVSSSISESDRRRAIEISDVSDYLIKPIDTAAFQRALEELSA